MYFASILRVFEHFLISYDERSFGSRGSVVDAESDYIDYIVYGCSIVDAKSEVSESGMNQFWPYPASPLAKTSEDNYWWDFWINVKNV